MTAENRFPWRDFWALTKPYWTSEEKWSAWGLLLVVIGLTLGSVYLNVLFNSWNRDFFTALQNYDEAAFWHELLHFMWIAVLAIIASVYQTYLGQMLLIRWRRWLTEHFVSRWLDHRAYYRLQLTGTGTDNPDQRISEDINLFVQSTLNLSLGLLNAVVTFFTFLGILWVLSESFGAALFGHVIPIPGFMFWVALVYGIFATWLINLIGRPLVSLRINQQRYEADFRFSLVRLRENSEAVALYSGEARERESFERRFASVVGNWWGIMRRQKRLTWWTSGYGQLAAVFPFVVMAPRYFAEHLAYGLLTQTVDAFAQVQQSLSFIINSYTDIASWRAVVSRLVTFHHAMHQAIDANKASGIVLQPSSAPAFATEDLDIALPDGKPLIAGAALQVQPGEAVLIAGRSGTGKSTLFRAMAGIWPFGQGRVRIPADAKVLFLPQKPYMPLGTLAECLSYPEPAGDTDDAAKRRALVDCGLEQFAERLAEEQNWGQALSPGEQQRVAFARILLKRPDWVFLDEATSALDEPLEQALYAKLKQRLPKLTMVSIGHRPGVAAYHERRLTLEAGDKGARLVAAAPVAAAE